MNHQPWHAPVWDKLKRLRDAGRLPHALLIDGDHGVGKRALVARLAAACLCTQPVDGEACGGCRACKLLAAGTHPDFIRIEFELNREGKPRRELVVDQVRALSQRLAMTSQFGGPQVAVIDPADALNVAAANALLKTLEEPTPDTLLMLVANASWRLPATVRSRCQRFTVPLPPRSEVATWLAEHEMDTDAIRLSMDAAGGNPGLALELADSGALARFAEVSAELDDLFAGRADAYSLACRWATDEPAQRLWFAARELHRRAATLAKAHTHAELDTYASAFSRLNRSRELLRGPLRPEWALFDVLSTLVPGKGAH